MRDDELQKLLSDDFLALAAKFDQDEFVDGLSSKLRSGDKMRLAIIAAAGVTGGVIAGAQFSGLTALAANFLPAIEIFGAQGSGSIYWPQFLASAALAIVAAATAAILPYDQ